MKPVNLYLLTRISDFRRFVLQEKLAAGRLVPSRLRAHEVGSVRAVVKSLMSAALPRHSEIDINQLDGFYCSYEIPQIGKEFDLLKIADNMILNIELKSVNVGADKIKEQLVRNRYFLGHLKRELMLFTYVSSDGSWYTLDGDRLVSCSAAKPAACLASGELDDFFKDDLDGLFRVSDYLVSPITTPERFLSSNYFLTQQQEDIKKKLMNRVRHPSASSYISVIGASGTGKTLLVYDLAKTLATERKKRCVLIHCGVLLEAHRLLKRSVPGLDIIAEGTLDSAGLSEYSFILIDEAHKLTVKRLAAIISRLNPSAQTCIFSFDESRYYSNALVLRRMTGYIRSLPGLVEFRLSGKIRANSEMSLLVGLLSGTEKKKYGPFKTVSLIYTADTDEAGTALSYMRARGYTFIGYADRRFAYKPDIDASRILGQEFERVVMLVDDSFYFTPDEILSDRAPSSSSGTRTDQLYQGILRTGGLLCLIVVSNETLFGRLQNLM